MKGAPVLSVGIGPSLPRSLPFDAIVGATPFRDLVAVRVNAAPRAIFRALHDVTLSEMKPAWLLGEIRYLPMRLTGRQPAARADQPFLSLLKDRGTLILVDDEPRELITGSAGRLHQIRDQPPSSSRAVEPLGRFASPATRSCS
jgi:hypothetical protein